MYIMNRMQIYIPDDMYQDLKTTARNSQIPMSHIVRRGLKKVLYPKQTVQKTKLNQFVGRYRGPVKTDAVNDIQALYTK